MRNPQRRKLTLIQLAIAVNVLVIASMVILGVQPKLDSLADPYIGDRIEQGVWALSWRWSTNMLVAGALFLLGRPMWLAYVRRTTNA